MYLKVTVCEGGMAGFKLFYFFVNALYNASKILFAPKDENSPVLGCHLPSTKKNKPLILAE